LTDVLILVILTFLTSDARLGSPSQSGARCCAPIEKAISLSQQEEAYRNGHETQMLRPLLHEHL